MALDTEVFQNLLEEERQRLEDELARIGTPTGVKGSYTTKFDEVGPDEEDNAVEMAEYVDAAAIESKLEDELNKVYEALAKIESGNYGLCEVCHEPIAPARLKAYPAAATCIKHA
ncbi:MAG: TraR/DksA C4-type zinc finger protein [Candidatus Moraniibacteriota bacterium]